jgi:hypothetical protein
MILVRNVFRLKFGQAREAIAAWKEGLAIAERAGVGGGRYRLPTGLAGPGGRCTSSRGHRQGIGFT